MSGIVASITMAAAILISEFSSGGSLGALFAVVIGFAISTTTLSYLFIFPTYLILRYKYPNVHRPYRVPGGIIGAWIVTVFLTKETIYPASNSSRRTVKKGSN